MPGRRRATTPASKILRLSDMHPEMQRAVVEPEVALYYNAFDRTYVVLAVEPGGPPAKHILPARRIRRNAPVIHAGGYVIYCCPWTGRFLPRNLVDLWELVAVERHGTEWGETLGQLDRLPAAMLSEDWWLTARTEDWWRKRSESYSDLDDSYEPAPAGEQVPPEEPYKPFTSRRRRGIGRPKERPPHLCWHLHAWFEGPRMMYAYLPQTREYGIRILDLDAVIDHQPVRIRPVPYCPWCGRRHPKPLRAEWERRLAALGLTPDSPRIPAALRSDTWWREAGL